MLSVSPPKGQELVRLLEDRPTVMVFSTASDYAYAPLVMRLSTVGPWREHYALPAVLAIEDPDERGRALDDYVAEVAARIEEARPEVLLFAPYGQALPPGVVMHDVFADKGAIPAEYTRVPDRDYALEDPRLIGWIMYRRTPGS
jgi:hypothetical protein